VGVLSIILSERSAHILSWDTSILVPEWRWRANSHAFKLMINRVALSRGLAVEGFLMSILYFSDRVLIHFSLEFFYFFGVAQTIVHHALIVRNKSHFTLELRVEVVLTLGEIVTLFLHSCTVALMFVSEPIVFHVVLPQTVVEGAFPVGGVIHESETT